MMHKRQFPDQLRQSKITAFCLKRSNDAGCVASGGARKRKNAADVSEVHLAPPKKSARSECTSPNIFQKSVGRASGENATANENKSELENYLFEDFENDPFLSPTKKESPKKKLLTENFSANETWPEDKSEITFETPVKCTVVKAKFVFDKCFEQVLLLSDSKLNGKGVCKLRDVWTSFSFSANDVVSIQAISREGHWVVDNKSGFVVLYPDVMVSSTALARSMFCMRQGVFANFFREMDSEESGKMLVGRLLHELFQETLRKGTRTEEDLGKIITEFLQSRGNLHDIFFSDVDILDIYKEMKKFIPSLKNFLDIYVDKQLEPGGNNFNGTIESVLDIEELVRSPTLGFQGRMDVTVRVKTKKGGKIAPLELKTGRASFSSEHRSQLILYVLLMNELGRKVESGLLLYLRENIMEEIFPTRDEIRNLFLMRNHFVKFCKTIGTHNLPEPIRNVRGCTKCSYLKVCTAFLRGGGYSQIPETHPIRNVEISDMKPSHVDYFVRWNKMLWLEFEEIEGTADDSEVSNLTLQPEVQSCEEHFRLDFLRATDSAKGALRPGTFVHVMNGKNRICTGQIVDSTDSRISILADRSPNDFSATYKLIVFRSTFLRVYLSNLAWLLREEFADLRELIIDKRTPRFVKNFDKTDFQEKCLKNLLSLNKDQRGAILKALLCEDYLLVKGPPGTGKSETIVTLIKILLALNKNVLIAGHTHSSVDNILLRLDGVEYLRLGTLRSIHEDIHKNSYAALRENCSSVDDIKKLFDRKLIASTCMGIDANLARRIKAEVCILDESSQILQVEALRPLFCCKKFILVGDEDQLPPIVRNPEARKLGMCQSMFEWLKNDHATVRLRLQYRMNSVINSLANGITYGGLIECANEAVAKATMKISDMGAYSQEDEWVTDVLSNDLEKSVVFVDTSEYFRLKREKYESEPRSSLIEANIVVRLISGLIKFGLKKHSLGVISPFWDQITLLKRKLAEKNLQEIELNTVDQYQGRDKDVILFSCTKENRSGTEVSGTELLSDERRLTVAVTRAKHKLIILGDKETVAKYEPFKKLIRNLKKSQFFRLSDGEKGFFWEKFSS